MKNMSTMEEKLNWIFTAFDADGGGSIDVEEINEVVLWMFREQDLALMVKRQQYIFGHDNSSK